MSEYIYYKVDLPQVKRIKEKAAKEGIYPRHMFGYIWLYRFNGTTLSYYDHPAGCWTLSSFHMKDDIFYRKDGTIRHMKEEYSRITEEELFLELL